MLVLLAGCQDLFKLEHVGNVDARTIDTVIPIDAIDAPPTACWDTTRTGNDDGDAYLDGCDPCPGNPNIDPTDSDSDGVPDVCDPEPNRAGNAILGFYPLTALGPDWLATGGQWSLQGADLRQTDITAASAQATFYTVVQPDTWVQVDVVGPDPASSPNTIAGLYLDTDNSTNPSGGITCDLVRTTSSMATTLQPQYWVNGSAMGGVSVDLGQVGEAWISGRALSGSCLAYVNGTLYQAGAPNGVNRAPAPALHTSFSAGTFKSMTLFSSAP